MTTHETTFDGSATLCGRKISLTMVVSPDPTCKQCSRAIENGAARP